MGKLSHRKRKSLVQDIQQGKKTVPRTMLHSTCHRQSRYMGSRGFFPPTLSSISEKHDILFMPPPLQTPKMLNKAHGAGLESSFWTAAGNQRVRTLKKHDRVEPILRCSGQFLFLLTLTLQHWNLVEIQCYWKQRLASQFTVSDNIIYVSYLEGEGRHQVGVLGRLVPWSSGHENEQHECLWAHPYSANAIEPVPLYISSALADCALSH